MKVLFIKKKFIINACFILFIMVLGGFFLYNKAADFNSASLQTIYPVNPSKDTEYDLTGDGRPDQFQLVNGDNKIDFCVQNSDSEFTFSKEIPDKTLFTKNIHWSPRIFISDLSRDSVPEIILLGSKNDKSIYYIFSWTGNKFNLISTGEQNIFGILDCKNTKTPECFALNSSSGTADLNSFMYVNNKILDTTGNESKAKLPCLGNVLECVKLVELNYNLDELPNIFAEDISSDELSIFWNLDKENYSYGFQNAFFYDYEWDTAGEPTAFKWRLSFEKNKLTGQDGDKEELSIVLDVVKVQNSYQIKSIQKV